MGIVTIQYSDNMKIKNHYGGFINTRIGWLQFKLTNTSKYLSSSEIPKKEYLDQTSAALYEDVALIDGITSSPMLLIFVNIINMDLRKMSSNIQVGKSENEIIVVKQSALDKISTLLNELNYIQDSCKENHIKYYQLTKSSSPIMNKVDRDLTDYLNKNNIH